MQYVNIKEEIKDGKTIYIVNAISLKNKSNSVVQKIPHPLGTDMLIYETLDEAKQAIELSGFSYILPSGVSNDSQTNSGNKNYREIVLNSIKSKINSSNTNVAAAAVLAISEFPEEDTYTILFSKLGEDNEVIRKNAIKSIARYGSKLQDKIIEALTSQDWVTRNSAIYCISSIVDSGSKDVEAYLIPLSNACNDSNVIVQANAISTVAKVYNAYVSADLKKN